MPLLQNASQIKLNQSKRDQKLRIDLNSLSAIGRHLPSTLPSLFSLSFCFLNVSNLLHIPTSDHNTSPISYRWKVHTERMNDTRAKRNRVDGCSRTGSLYCLVSEPYNGFYVPDGVCNIVRALFASGSFCRNAGCRELYSWVR